MIMTARTSRLATTPPERPVAAAELLPHLISIAKSVRQLVAIKLAERDIAPGQDQFLLCFENGVARSSACVAASLSVRASTVSKMVDILERKGWVVRRPDERDARKVLLSLTEAGHRAQDDVRGIWRSLENELAPKLANQSDAVKLLSAIDAALEHRLKRLR
jgi:DNA-binding MarR family transcriptional regulator